MVGRVKPIKEIVDEFKRSVLAFLLACWIFIVLFYFCGGSLDGVLYGRWPEIDDHPTNWLDTALHPGE